MWNCSRGKFTCSCKEACLIRAVGGYVLQSNEMWCLSALVVFSESVRVFCDELSNRLVELFALALTMCVREPLRPNTCGQHMLHH